MIKIRKNRLFICFPFEEVREGSNREGTQAMNSFNPPMSLLSSHKETRAWWIWNDVNEMEQPRGRFQKPIETIKDSEEIRNFQGW